MKKIALLLTILFGLFVSPLYAMKEPVVDEGKVSEIVHLYYPNLVEYYDEGVMDVVWLYQETLGDGSTQYDIRYKFVNNYYEGEELEKVLREQYPDIYMMRRGGFLKDVCAYKFVDKATGKILTYVAYNRAVPERRPMPRMMRRG